MICRHIQHFLHVIRTLDEQKISHVPGKIVHHLSQFPSLIHQMIHRPDGTGHIFCQHLAQQCGKHFRIHCTEHFQHIFIGEFFPQMKGNTLVEQTQRITHRTVPGFCHITQCALLDIHLFGAHQFRQTIGNGINGNPVKIISLATGQNRNRDLVCFRCRKNKNHICRRLLQRLEQRVECACRQHMHLINNVNLVFSLCRAVRYFFPDLPDIVHAVVRCRINLYDIHRSPGGNALTCRAFSTGTSVYRVFTIYCFCKNLCNCRLSGTPGTAKQISMSYAIGFDLVL